MQQVVKRASARGNNINPRGFSVVTWYRRRMVAGAPEHTLSIQRARPGTKFKLLHLTLCDGRGAACSYRFTRLLPPCDRSWNICLATRPNAYIFVALRMAETEVGPRLKQISPSWSAWSEEKHELFD